MMPITGFSTAPTGMRAKSARRCPLLLAAAMSENQSTILSP